MTNSLNLSEKEKLNGSYYETWKWKLKNVLMSENLGQYLEKDIIMEVGAKDLNTAIENKKKKAYSILSNSLTDDVAIKIKNIEKKPNLVMANLKKYYDNNNTKGMTHWMNKLNNFKS
ncbi:hypothetical protein U3516DRAFT_739801 [Neocallimastix sp. 'constans']